MDKKEEPIHPLTKLWVAGEVLSLLESSGAEYPSKAVEDFASELDKVCAGSQLAGEVRSEVKTQNIETLKGLVRRLDGLYADEVAKALTAKTLEEEETHFERAREIETILGLLHISLR